MLCLKSESKLISQQNALHSRQALLSAVYCNAGDTLLCGLCVHASFHVLYMLGFQSYNACAESVMCLNPCSSVCNSMSIGHGTTCKEPCPPSIAKQSRQQRLKANMQLRLTISFFTCVWQALRCCPLAVGMLVCKSALCLPFTEVQGIVDVIACS